MKQEQSEVERLGEENESLKNSHKEYLMIRSLLHISEEKIKELESKLSQLQAKVWHEGYSALWNWIEEEEFRRKNLLPYINKPTNPYLESKLAEQSEGQDGLWKEAFELFYEHNAKELKSKFKLTRV